MKRALLFAALLGGCAARQTEPRILSDVSAARTAPAARDAEQRAPQAYAHAVELERRARAQNAAGDAAGAQILGEQALAAYEHAAVLARLTGVAGRQTEASAKIARAETELQSLDAQQKKVQAETEDIELRTRVLTDALPVAAAGPAGPERERAREAAARALALQARLLCASARLLEPSRPALAGLFAELDQLEQKPSKPEPAPLDKAVNLRSRCLTELSQARRPKLLADPSNSDEDQLLTQLSSAAYGPNRDERGVVVTLRGVFAKGTDFVEARRAQLDALGRIANQHKPFPILVVLHTAAASAEQDRKRLAAVTAVLQAAGAEHVEAALAGDAAPVIEPKRERSASLNERIEIVFVSPRT
jgi:hypothetical protein